MVATWKPPIQTVTTRSPFSKLISIAWNRALVIHCTCDDFARNQKRCAAHVKSPSPAFPLTLIHASTVSVQSFSAKSFPSSVSAYEARLATECQHIIWRYITSWRNRKMTVSQRKIRRTNLSHYSKCMHRAISRPQQQRHIPVPSHLLLRCGIVVYGSNSLAFACRTADCCQRRYSPSQGRGCLL